MYLGIDLGTSNSAIAYVRDGRAAVFKTPEGTEVMPSVIYRDRRGNQTVGVRAYDQATLAPENVVHGFKRLMGTATPQRFASSGQGLTPEEASAEVLRAMVAYALVEAGTNIITGAVVTTPAAFNQMQSEATLAAAHAAGLERVALLQEPVAAALAAIANARNRSGLFLVYHMGGGTFDVALVQAIEGSVTVLAHEGINMLGGRDFDRIIVDNVVRPWLTRRFRLPENLQADKRYDRLIRVAKRGAEIAKIDLSTQDVASINASEEIIRLEDECGEPLYLDVPLDRRTLESLIPDRVDQSLALCRKVLDDNGYSHEDVERVVLIGGPTKMPVIRRRVQDELGIAIEDVSRVDPMTAVAIGAAIYCESRDWSDARSVAKPKHGRIETTGAVAVAYDYEARTASTHARLTIRPGVATAGAGVEVSSKLGWTSGRRSLATPVVLELDLPDVGTNRFDARVFDQAGRLVQDASRVINIERLLATTGGTPATQTIGVKVLDDNGVGNTLTVLVRKGTLLPASGAEPYRSAATIRAGSTDVFRVELFQLASEQVSDPELNLPVGEFRIAASDLPESMSIRRGDKIVLHWAIGEGQGIKAEVDLPSVGQRFDHRNFYVYQASAHSFEGEEGDSLVRAMLDLAELDLVKAEESVPPAFAAELVPLRTRLENQCVSAGTTIDPDTRRSVAEETRGIRQDIARVCLKPEARKQVLRRRLEEEVRFYDRYVRPDAAEEANDAVDALKRNAIKGIEAGSPASLDLVERQIREIDGFYWRAGLKQERFCTGLWSAIRDTRHLARDRDLFDKTKADGDRAVAVGNLDGVQKAIYAAWGNRIAIGVQQHVRERAWLMRN